MARQTREEWVSGLREGDEVTAKLPGNELPSVGTLRNRFDERLVCEFHGGFYDFTPAGIYARDPSVLLWMNATGKGGSTGPAGLTTNALRAMGITVEDGR
jgi:hypothetical protein